MKDTKRRKNAARRKHPIRRAIIAIPTLLAIVVLAYVAYVFIDYHRIPDMQPVTPVAAVPAEAKVEPGTSYTAVTYNIGFGAYAPDYDFFMDGGKQSWAASKESVIALTEGAGQLAAAQAPDFLFLEEVDLNSTRSYHVDQKTILDRYFLGYDSLQAINYDSPFLFYPITQPHGKSLSSLLMYARFPMQGGLRRSLPISTSVSRLLDLDRCYMVTRFPMTDGRELVCYTIHMTAYTSDSSIRDGQLAMLIADMTAEYEAGNAVICGGDFNMEMLSTELGENTAEWAMPLERSHLGVMVNAWDAASDKTPAQLSCRDAGVPYDPATTKSWMVDSFIVSPNVIIEDVTCVATGYQYSDHDPVRLTFHIK